MIDLRTVRLPLAHRRRAQGPYVMAPHDSNWQLRASYSEIIANRTEKLGEGRKQRIQEEIKHEEGPAKGARDTGGGGSSSRGR